MSFEVFLSEVLSQEISRGFNLLSSVEQLGGADRPGTTFWVNWLLPGESEILPCPSVEPFWLEGRAFEFDLGSPFCHTEAHRYTS